MPVCVSCVAAALYSLTPPAPGFPHGGPGRGTSGGCPRAPRGPLVAPHGPCPRLRLSVKKKVLSVTSNGKAVFAKYGAGSRNGGRGPMHPLHPENMDATCSDA